MKAFILSPFRAQGRWNVALVGLFILINLIVAFNAVHSSATGGYDAGGHQKNIATLATFRLPGPDDSREFFSPPLPYLFPAALIAFLRIDPYRASKYAQLLNVLLSLGTTLFLLHLCELVRPADDRLKFTTLLIFGVLPVYYKTFSFVRGEPFVVFLAVVAAWQSLRVFLKPDYRPISVAALGLTLGLLALARQWGILVVPAVVVLAGLALLTFRTQRRALALALGASLVIALLVGGWYYAVLRLTYGTAAAFNRAPAAQFSLANQPPEFYFGMGNGRLFSDPIDRSFPDQLLPIFYSEVWGDYWGFFVLYVRDSVSKSLITGDSMPELFRAGSVPAGIVSNRFTINGYLGAVNAAGLLPTMFAVVAVLAALGASLKAIAARDFSAPSLTMLFFVAIIGSSLAGYLWFLIQYPSPDGDTIKATYMLHVFPVAAILTALFLQRITARQRWLYAVAIAYLISLFVFNLQAMISQFV